MLNVPIFMLYLTEFGLVPPASVLGWLLLYIASWAIPAQPVPAALQYRLRLASPFGNLQEEALECSSWALGKEQSETS